MIVIFHTFCLLVRYVYDEIFITPLSRLELNCESNERNLSKKYKYQVPSETDIEEGRGLRFFPQLYVQRYCTVRGVLEDEKWKGKIKKVVDFGCAEFGFFQYLKKLEGVQEVLEVDIDRELLEQHYCRIVPLNCDYLNQRSEPLTVYVLQGSIAYPDNYLLGCDAVICIELIEHLYPDVLENLPYTVFGFIKPLVAVFTTPNEEFNVLFTDFSGFRHPDHKFEWTRSQFESWANNIVSRYTDYSVHFYGIGLPLPSHQNVGGCSQMAVFERLSSDITHRSCKDIILQDEDPALKYQLLRKCEYPFSVDTRSDRTKIREQVDYYIHFYASCDDYLVDDRPQVPLTTLLPHVSKWTSSIDELGEILKENNWVLVEHSSGGLAILYPDNQSSSEEEEEEELEFIDKSCVDKNSEPTDVENWDNSSNSNGLTSENWNFDYTEKNSKFSDIEWSDEGETNNDKVPMSVSEPFLQSLNILAEKDQSSFVMTKSKSISQVSSEKNVKNNSCNLPVNKGPSENKNCAALCFYLSSESEILSNTQVLVQSMMRQDDVENCTGVADYTQWCTTERKDSSISGDLKTENIDVDSSLQKPGMSEREAQTLLSTPDLLDKYGFHNCSSSMHVNVQSVLLKSDSSSNHLNLQLEGQGVSVMEFTKKPEGLSDSPVACSFSLEDPNDRQVDSGYPNSTSAQDMDLDLTPEQVDEIFTENDVMTDQPLDHQLDSISVSSRDSDSVSEHHLAPVNHPPVIVPQPDMLFEEDMNVENGDVANNNRDGEGNNAVAIVPRPHDVMGENDNNGGVVLPENFDDLIPLIAAAEDLDNDNEIELNGVEPFPPWLLNLLGLANGGGVGGRDQHRVEDGHSSEDDSDNNIDRVDEGLGEDDNLDSSSASDTCVSDVAVDLEGIEKY